MFCHVGSLRAHILPLLLVCKLSLTEWLYKRGACVSCRGSRERNDTRILSWTSFLEHSVSRTSCVDSQSRYLFSSQLVSVHLSLLGRFAACPTWPHASGAPVSWRRQSGGAAVTTRSAECFGLRRNRNAQEKMKHSSGNCPDLDQKCKVDLQSLNRLQMGRPFAVHQLIPASTQLDSKVFCLGRASERDLRRNKRNRMSCFSFCSECFVTCTAHLETLSFKECTFENIKTRHFHSGLVSWIQQPD